MRGVLTALWRARRPAFAVIGTTVIIALLAPVWPQGPGPGPSVCFGCGGVLDPTAKVTQSHIDQTVRALGLMAATVSVVAIGYLALGWTDRR